MIFKTTSTQIGQCLENKFYKGLKSVNTSCSTPVSVSGSGVTFDWYQSYGLVGSRTTIARMSLAIHALMLMFKRVMTSDG